MVTEVRATNEQDERDLDTAALARLARHCLAAEGVTGECELTLTFVSPEAIAALNERFLGRPGPTDVLSFGIEDDPRARPPAHGQAPLLLGDVVICPEIAFANAPEHANSYDDELELLVVHGILHLLGMDHEDEHEAEEMEARERAILATHRAAAR